MIPRGTPAPKTGVPIASYFPNYTLPPDNRSKRVGADELARDDSDTPESDDISWLCESATGRISAKHLVLENTLRGFRHSK